MEALFGNLLEEDEKKNEKISINTEDKGSLSNTRCRQTGTCSGSWMEVCRRKGRISCGRSGGLFRDRFLSP